MLRWTSSHLIFLLDLLLNEWFDVTSSRFERCFRHSFRSRHCLFVTVSSLSNTSSRFGRCFRHSFRSLPLCHSFTSHCPSLCTTLFHHSVQHSFTTLYNTLYNTHSVQHSLCHSFTPLFVALSLLPVHHSLHHSVHPSVQQSLQQYLQLLHNRYAGQQIIYERFRPYFEMLQDHKAARKELELRAERSRSLLEDTEMTERKVHEGRMSEIIEDYKRNKSDCVRVRVSVSVSECE